MSLRYWAALVCAVLCCSPASADEGMWPFDRVPFQLLLRRYRVQLDAGWLRRVQHSCVRLSNGGSGAVVSGDGLILTNYHVGAQYIGSDDVYCAPTRSQEPACPGLEVKLLQSIEDVTAAVASSSPVEVQRAEAARSGFACEVISFDLGYTYQVYRYKVFTDIRLVMAPPRALATFGGEQANFAYPRHSLDFCFFRLYQGNAPVSTPDYFKVVDRAVGPGQLVFLAGHPLHSERRAAYDRFEHLRFVTIPYRLQTLRSRYKALLNCFSRGYPEAIAELDGLSNLLTTLDGQLRTLDPAFLRARKAWQESLPVKSRPHWRTIANCQRCLAQFEIEYSLVEEGDGFNSRLFRQMRHLVRFAREVRKPSAARLAEYREERLPQVERVLLAPTEVRALEIAKLRASLRLMRELLGPSHPSVVLALAGQEPGPRAIQLVDGCQIRERARRQLLFQEPARLSKLNDPMADLVIGLEKRAMALRQRFRLQVEEPQARAYAQLTPLLSPPYPDADGSLRLSFGRVLGYRDGKFQIPAATTLGEMVSLARKKRNLAPYALPVGWTVEPGSSVQLDFVSDADSVSGSSGSPVFDAQRNLVGLNFDRNRQGLDRVFTFTDRQARNISVSSTAILHTLQVYRCQAVLAELKAP